MTRTFDMILVEMSEIRRLANGHLRFGQIIGNALSDRFKGDPYYVEDDELLAASAYKAAEAIVADGQKR